MTTKQPSSKFDWASLAFGALAVLFGSVAGLLIGYVSNPLVLIVMIGGMFTVIGMLTHAEWGLLALVVMTYVRFSDVLIKYHGMPSTAKPFIALLVLIILVRWLIYKERPAGWERSALLIAAYGLVGLISLLYAADFALAQEALSDFFKDAIVAVIIAVLLQRAATLRRVIWALLVVGIFMGTISVFQQLTGTHENDYWGFGQAVIKNVVEGVDDYRISGPIGSPNFYAQILVVLVPLALDRLWNERNTVLRVLAAWALVVCGLSIVFTFSRGGFVALIVVLVIMLIRRPPHPVAMLVTIALIIPLLQFVPPQYTERMETLVDLLPFSGESAASEVSFRGRLSENAAGWLMFTDHPILGVGLNNYTIHYQEYSRTLGLDPRREARAPHSLYLQIASETGLLGLITFGAIIWVMFSGMRRAQRDFMQAGMPNYAGMVVAFSIGMMGYLTTAIFLHAAYPRFFWLLLGIALAMPYVAQRELAEREKTQSARPPHSRPAASLTHV